MKNILQRIFLKNIHNYGYWIVLAVIVKALFFSFMIHQNISKVEPGTIYVKSGDTGSYVAPIENFISKGEYSPDFRMPGYGALYFLFRMLFPLRLVLNFLAITQLLLGALSVYFLALIARDIFRSNDFFYMVFYGYLLSTYTSIFDVFILTESLAVSILIVTMFCFIRGMHKRNNVLLFLAGLFLTWSIFLRPFLFPLLIFFIIALVLFFKRSTNCGNFTAMKGIIIFLLPFLLIDGAWIIRNQRIYNKIIPLQQRIYYLKQDKMEIRLLNFIKSWGGDCVSWNPKAEINWFEFMEHADDIKRQIKDIRFPDYIYTSKFDHDNLVDIKKYISFSKDKALPLSEQNRFRQLASDELFKCTESIRKEKPYLYYITSRLKLFKKFLLHSGTYNLFSKTAEELNAAELMFKLMSTLLYFSVVIFGFIGVVFLFFKRCFLDGKFLIAAIPLYIIIFFPIIFRIIEYRYFALAYPFMLVCASCVFFQIISLRKTRGVKYGSCRLNRK